MQAIPSWKGASRGQYWTGVAVKSFTSVGVVPAPLDVLVDVGDVLFEEEVLVLVEVCGPVPEVVEVVAVVLGRI